MRLIAAVVTGFALLLVAPAAYAADRPRQDNGSLVVPIAIVVFVAVVAGLLFIASRYRDQ